MKTHKTPLIRLVIGLFTLIISSGCAGGQITDLEDPLFQDALDTAVAGAVASQKAEFDKTLAAVSATHTPAPTSTPLPASPTPEPTNKPALREEDLPLVSVSVDTNCRSGPSKVYRYQAGFFIGDEATVYGINPPGTWLYIAHPDAPDGYCWIWRRYASTSSNVDPLPIFTPGPTPDTRPEFLAEYNELEICNGKWIVEFNIENTGSVPLQSVAVHVLNTENSEESGRAEMNSFRAQEGCDITVDQARLDPVKSGFTISQDLTQDPAGNLLFATITVCSEDNLALACLTKEFYFTP